MIFCPKAALHGQGWRRGINAGLMQTSPSTTKVCQLPRCNHAINEVHLLLSRQCSFKAGQIMWFLLHWQEITNDPTILWYYSSPKINECLDFLMTLSNQGLSYGTICNFIHSYCAQWTTQKLANQVESATCPYISHILTTYAFLSTGEMHPIKSNLTCHTKNLIHMIQCKCCNLQ